MAQNNSEDCYFNYTDTKQKYTILSLNLHEQMKFRINTEGVLRSFVLQELTHDRDTRNHNNKQSGQSKKEEPTTTDAYKARPTPHAANLAPDTILLTNVPDEATRHHARNALRMSTEYI